MSEKISLDSSEKEYNFFGSGIGPFFIYSVI